MVEPFNFIKQEVLEEEKNKMLNAYILHADRYKGALKIGGPSQNTCFVRWDAMCILLKIVPNTDTILFIVAL